MNAWINSKVPLGVARGFFVCVALAFVALVLAINRQDRNVLERVTERVQAGVREISAGELTLLFLQNELAAEALFKQGPMGITGQVMRVSTGVLTGSFVEVKATSDSSVTLILSDEARDAAAKLAAGQDLLLWCPSATLFFGSVSAVGCRFTR